MKQQSAKHYLYLCSMTKRFIILFSFIGIILAGCSQVTRISNVNMAHSYYPEKRSINPVYRISHIDEDLSLIHLKVHADQLFYVRDAREEFYLANYKLTVSLYNSFAPNGHLLTQTYLFADTLHVVENRLVENEMTFPIPMGNSYQIFVLFEDLNRRISETTLLSTDKNSIFSEGFFTVSEVDKSTIHLPPLYLPADEEFLITHVRDFDFSMEVHLYSLLKEIPTAPYVPNQEDTVNLIPDSIFTVNFTGGTSRFHIPENGLYRFSEPGNTESGFTIRSFWNEFPGIPSGDAMLLPLRFITSGEEYDALLALGDAQLAAERFWARSAGNPDRGATMMRNYNQRVVEANSLFSSFLPGWQTEKGMIYIIFGPPDMVYHDDEAETWYINEGLNSPGAEIKFLRTKHFLSDNHYELERKSGFRRNWNHAVDRWRR